MFIIEAHYWFDESVVLNDFHYTGSLLIFVIWVMHYASVRSRKNGDDKVYYNGLLQGFTSLVQ